MTCFYVRQDKKPPPVEAKKEVDQQAVDSEIIEKSPSRPASRAASRADSMSPKPPTTEENKPTVASTTQKVKSKLGRPPKSAVAGSSGKARAVTPVAEISRSEASTDTGGLAEVHERSSQTEPEPNKPPKKYSLKYDYSRVDRNIKNKSTFRILGDLSPI